MNRVKNIFATLRYKELPFLLSCIEETPRIETSSSPRWPKKEINESQWPNYSIVNRWSTRKETHNARALSISHYINVCKSWCVCKSERRPERNPLFSHHGEQTFRFFSLISISTWMNEGERVVETVSKPSRLESSFSSCCVAQAPSWPRTHLLTLEANTPEAANFVTRKVEIQTQVR